MSTEQPINYSCPYCDHRNIETTAAAPYVRGFLLAYQVGSKTYIGCAPCVRKKVLAEAGLSLLIGWFSITALIINPFLILYNLLRAPFIRPDYAKARQKLAEAGIPDDQDQVDVTQLGYCLAASMITADGHVDPQEIAIAQEIGRTIFPDFDDAQFQAVVTGGDLPSPQDISTLLREMLTEEGKKAICTYLLQIAMADGKVDPAEKQLLADVASNLDLDLASLQTTGSAAGTAG